MLISPVIAAYYTAWSVFARSYLIADIPGDKITHLNYAFANIDLDGRIALGYPWVDTKKPFDGDEKNQALLGNFNRLIKIEGEKWSANFSDVAASDASRSIFAVSCVRFVQMYDFDGIDLDWEYPVSGGLLRTRQRPEDKQNYVLLLKELRRQLDTVADKKYLLTVATAAGPTRIEDLDLPGMAAYVDWMNVMAYNFHGSWESTTGHRAALYQNNLDTSGDKPPLFMKSRYNCNASIQAYLTAGVPRTKLVLGLSLSGRGWQEVTNTDQNGYCQPASAQSPTGTWTNGVFDYDDLRTNFFSSYRRYWDDQSKVPFLFNASTGIWITYDDLESVAAKNDYINKEQLRGAMFWELSGDRQAELIGTTFQSLNTNFLPITDGTA